MKLINQKNFPTWTKDKERKTENDGERKNLVEEELGQNKMLFSCQQGRTANGQTAITSSPALFAPKRQISGILLASDS